MCLFVVVTASNESAAFVAPNNFVAQSSVEEITDNDATCLRPVRTAKVKATGSLVINTF